MSTRGELLSAVEAAHNAYVDARRKMRAEIERQFEERLAALRVQEAIAAARAVREGASKSRVGRAMGTTNWDTIRERLEVGERLLGDASTVTTRFSWEFAGTVPVYGSDAVNEIWYLLDAETDNAFSIPGPDGNPFAREHAWLYLTTAEGLKPWEGQNPPADVQAWVEGNPPA